MSKGGGTPSTTTNQTQLPAFIQEAAAANLGQANTVAANLQTPYTGNVVAGLTPDQLASFAAIDQLQGQAGNTISRQIPKINQAGQGIQQQIGNINAASGTVGGVIPQLQGQSALATQQAGNVSNAINAIGAQAPVLGQAEQMTANLPQSAQSLLDPYLGTVIGATMPQMLRSQAQQLNTIQGQEEAAGAFGGSRAGVNEALTGQLSEEAIGQQIANIASTGWDTAVSQALQQGTNLAGMAQTGAQMAGLAGNLGLGQAGATTAAGGLLTSAGQLGIGQGQLAEGAISGETAAANAAQAAAQTAALGQTTNLQGIAAQSAAGQQQQNEQQALLDMLAQQYAAQGNYPLQQLAINESALQATPYGTTTTSQQSASTPGVGSQIMSGIGTALTLASLL